MWYPGSGRDFPPVLCGIEKSLGIHFVRSGERDQSGIVLWMSDYRPAVISSFANWPELNPIYQPLRGGDKARRDSISRWAEGWGKEESSAVTWDLAELNVGGISVRFSPFESQAMLEHVFPAMKVQIIHLLLIRLGSHSFQRPGFDHHSRKFWRVMTEYARDSATTLPRYIISDKERIAWTWPTQYCRTEINLPWNVHEEPAKTFQRENRFPDSLAGRHAAILRSEQMPNYHSLKSAAKIGGSG